ncbi:ribbon-helix-helix protein, CopG family [Paenarthrobacter ureafaciens]|uniref:ribbon-helix-helix protein, CopG family n=1 Tax=Paenarthrobacter ureafaciens TaxID=37931 RepID=UPI00398A53A8
MARMRQIEIRLPEPLIGALDEIADASGLSRSAAIRTLLTRAVSKSGTDDD